MNTISLKVAIKQLMFKTLNICFLEHALILLVTNTLETRSTELLLATARMKCSSVMGL